MRRAAILLTLAAVFAAVLAAPARAGTFRLSQCNAVDLGGLVPRGYQADLWRVDGGWPIVRCGVGGGQIRFATPNYRLLHDTSTAAHFDVPGSMPGTTLRTAWLDWLSIPQAAGTNPAYLSVHAGGALLLQAVTGVGTAPGRAQRISVPAGARRMHFETWCSPVNGPGWCNWPGPLLELRGLTLELEEHGEPAAAASGPLLQGGARTGAEPVEVTASDADSGVRRVVLSLGGVPVGSFEPASGCRDDRLPPCPQALRGTIDVDTRRVPDGAGRLRILVTDGAGNARTVDAGTVTVRNQPPAGDTIPAPGPPIGPATTRGPVGAPPAADGPGGEGRRRAPFPPNPGAGRGHEPNGTNASERARVSAWLQPRRARRRSEVRRRSVTVPWGVRVRIRGRVTDPRGRAIGGAALAAVAREPGRRWRAITGVRTRPNGRFTAFTRIGPSRELRFVYYAFGDSSRGRWSPRLRVTVR